MGSTLRVLRSDIINEHGNVDCGVRGFDALQSNTKLPELEVILSTETLLKSGSYGVTIPNSELTVVA